MIRPLLFIFLVGSAISMAGDPPAAEKSAAADQPASDKPLTEDDLVGTYVHLRSGGVMQFEKGGRILGWPSGGRFKILGKGRIELHSGAEGKEERLPVMVERADRGLVLAREVDGKKEYTPLLKLELTKPDATAWQGPATLHLLLAGEKTATKREVTLDKDGFLRTKEGGFYLKFFERAGNTLAFVSGLEERTKWVNLYKSGPIIVIFDSLVQPSLMAVIELKETK